MTPRVLGSVYLGGAYFFLRAGVTGAIFALGIGGLFVAWDRRWTAAATTLEVLGIMLSLTFVSGLRASADLDLSRPLTLTLILGLGLTLAGGAPFYASMHRPEQARRRLPGLKDQDIGPPAPSQPPPDRHGGAGVAGRPSRRPGEEVGDQGRQRRRTA